MRQMLLRKEFSQKGKCSEYIFNYFTKGVIMTIAIMNHNEIDKVNGGSLPSTIWSVAKNMGIQYLITQGAGAISNYVGSLNQGGSPGYTDPMGNIAFGGSGGNYTRLPE